MGQKLTYRSKFVAGKSGQGTFRLIAVVIQDKSDSCRLHLWVARSLAGYSRDLRLSRVLVLQKARIPLVYSCRCLKEPGGRSISATHPNVVSKEYSARYHVETPPSKGEPLHGKLDGTLPTIQRSLWK